MSKGRPEITREQVRILNEGMQEASDVVRELNRLTEADEALIPDSRTENWARRMDRIQNKTDPVIRESDDIKRLLAHDAIDSLHIFYRVIPRLNRVNRSATFSIENVQGLARNALWAVLNSVQSLEYWTGDPLETRPVRLDEMVREGHRFLKHAVSKRAHDISVGVIMPELTTVQIHRGTIGNLLSNIVINAVHHGQADDVVVQGAVGVELQCHEVI